MPVTPLNFDKFMFSLGNPPVPVRHPSVFVMRPLMTVLAQREFKFNWSGFLECDRGMSPAGLMPSSSSES